MKMSIRIVQFSHPGVEHMLTRRELKTSPIVKEWNNGAHKRKFLRARGVCVSSDDTLSEEKDLLFWGEWEPYSEVEVLTYNMAQKNRLLPTYVHKPFLKVQRNGSPYYYIYFPPTPKSKNSLARVSCTDIICDKNKIPRSNTDPFVFGDYFLYSCCRQYKKNGGLSYTYMKYLKEGSLILFGSSVLNSPNEEPYFALDTVFVVAESRLYNIDTYDKDLSDFIPQYYDEIMGFKYWDKGIEMRCYHGATVENRINGMYSFVPCKSCSSETPSWGFERPKLRASMFNHIVKGSKSIINEKASQGFRSFDKNCYAFFDEETVSQVWQLVREQVLAQGFEIGVRIKYELH